MAKKIYQDKELSDEELRRITGVRADEEDQIEAAAREGAKEDLAERESLAGSQDAAGQHNRSDLTPEELQEAEERGSRLGNLRNPSWYKGQAFGYGKGFLKEHLGEMILKEKPKNFIRRNKIALIVALILNVAIAGLLIFIFFFIAPFKHVHFETVMRAANFAHFQLIVRKQFSSVIFNASVLTEDSVGNHRNSPLVRQTRLSVPDYQIAELGRQRRLNYEFHPNSSFGHEFLPFRESLKAVIIDGERFDIDEYAQRSFGRNYRDLKLRERFTVQNEWVRAVNVKTGNLMALTFRHVRWNPMTHMRQATRLSLVWLLNKGRDYVGLKPDEARAKFAEQKSKKVWQPRAGPVSALDDINEGARESQQELLNAAKEGRAPEPAGSRLRSRIVAGAEAARGISDAVFAGTAWCVGRELVKVFTPELQREREAQAARMAGDDMSATDQIKTADTVPTTTGLANEQWDGQGDVPDAADSVMYRRVTGQQPPPQSTTTYQQQVPMFDPTVVLGDLQDDFNQFNEVAGPFILAGPNIVGILSLFGINIGGNLAEGFNNKVCNALLKEQVQWTIAGGELVLTAVTLGAAKGLAAAVKGVLELGFHIGVGLALDQLLNLMIEWTTREFARTYFTGLEQGADRFNTGYVAQNSIAQNSNRLVTFGRPCTLEEANTAQLVAMNALRAENREKPFMQRYFAIDNPFSLTGRMVAELPASSGGLAASTHDGLRFMGSILSSPMQLFGSLANAVLPFKTAQAAGVAFTDSTFGVEQWCWPQEEQERVETDPSFSMIAEPGQDPPLLARVEPRMEDLTERYGKCYDETKPLQSDIPDECTRDLLSEEDALYWRYYMSLMFAAEHLTGDI